MSISLGGHGSRTAHLRELTAWVREHPVQVFVLITEDTIEEKLLSTLSAKHNLALAALDAESDVDQVVRWRHRRTPPASRNSARCPPRSPHLTGVSAARVNLP